MDPVSATSSQSFQCGEAVVDAGMAGSACLASIVTTAATSPTGVGLVVGGLVTVASCAGAGWYGAKADILCGDNGSGGMSPANGSDGMDFRNAPADAAWRSGVVIEPIESSEAMVREEGFEHRDSSF